MKKAKKSKPKKPKKTAKIVISTDRAPRAVGPYSQAIRMGNLLFISGQIALDPVSGNLVGENVTEQTEQVFKNLKGILASQRLTLKHLLKTSVYLTNLGEWTAFNDIYEKNMPAPYPARATVEVSKLPKGALVEIEAIAHFDS